MAVERLVHNSLTDFPCANKLSDCIMIDSLSRLSHLHFGMTGVALGDMDVAFAWQAWPLMARLALVALVPGGSTCIV